MPCERVACVEVSRFNFHFLILNLAVCRQQNLYFAFELERNAGPGCATRLRFQGLVCASRVSDCACAHLPCSNLAWAASGGRWEGRGHAVVEGAPGVLAAGWGGVVAPGP